MTRPERIATDAQKTIGKRQFVGFSFFKVDPAWRRLEAAERVRGKKEFAAVIEKFTGDKRLMILPYTTVGMRADTEIMLWRIGYSLEAVQENTTQLLATGLGRYLTCTQNFLAMTKRSTYIDKLDPLHQEDRMHIIPGQMKYIFVYPFVKSRDWYLKPHGERQRIMDEHIRVGSKYQSVKLNTTYSFGLDDQEFVVAFETDHPEDFLDLVMELRETEGSKYTLRDTPIFTCIAKSVPEMLDSLGG